jgi:hypothetical protein
LKKYLILENTSRLEWMDGLSLILSGCKFHSRTEDGMKEL